MEVQAVFLVITPDDTLFMRFRSPIKPLLLLLPSFVCNRFVRFNSKYSLSSSPLPLLLLQTAIGVINNSMERNVASGRGNRGGGGGEALFAIRTHEARRRL